MLIGYVTVIKINSKKCEIERICKYLGIMASQHIIFFSNLIEKHTNIQQEQTYTLCNGTEK